ncbi:MAG: SDR family oxidoreductase, partial [bacterium]
GTLRRRPVPAHCDASLWNRQFALNATTAYLTARAFLPLLRSAKGAMVFFASEAILPGGQTAGISAYAASKSALVALMQSIALEEKATGVRANAVAPTSIRTAANLASMGPDATYVSREDVANVVLWLCSEDAHAVTGQIVPVR